MLLAIKRRIGPDQNSAGPGRWAVKEPVNGREVILNNPDVTADVHML
jgi:hypothetical protein